MLVSHDSGGTWNTINTDLNVKDTLSTFEFVNASTGWALTSDISGHHSLYKTTDGGATWNVLIP